MKGAVVTHNFENGPTKDNLPQVSEQMIFFSQNMHNLYKSLKEKFNRKNRKEC
jgi:hypothetical protein